MSAIHAIHVAARVGDLEKVTRLLQDGVDVNAKNADGASVLMTATIYGRLSVVEYLLTVPGVNVNAKHASFGVTPLMVAVLFNPEVIKCLLSHPSIDVNAMDKNGDTALAIACLPDGNSAAVAPLLEHPSLDNLDAARLRPEYETLLEAQLRWRARRHWIVACMYPN